MENNGTQTVTITLDTLEFMHLYQVLKNVEEATKASTQMPKFNEFLLFKAVENFEGELTKGLTEEHTDYAADQYEKRSAAFELTFNKA